ncbi:MAG TPA: YdbL family protein [Geminicoccaceae bacterium]|nr:YdbL family protein [Geminicoccaceae bacterium]
MTSAFRLFAGLALALALVLGGGSAPPAAAVTLDQAKTAGLLGERFDGYLGLVDANAPADVRALMETINAQRRTRYAEIAANRGVPVEAVGKLTAEKVINGAPPGTYFMGPDGRWRRK